MHIFPVRLQCYAQSCVISKPLNQEKKCNVLTFSLLNLLSSSNITFFSVRFTNVQNTVCTLPVFRPYPRASLERAPLGSHCSSCSVTGWGWAGRCSAFWRPRRANSSPAAAAASSRPRSHASPPRSETENFSWNKRQFIIKACRKLQHFNANTQSSRALNYFQSSDLYGPINSHYIHAPRYFSILEYSCILTARGKDSTSSVLWSLGLYYAATCGPRHVFVLTLTGHCSLSVESVFPRYRRLAHGPRGPRPAGLGCRPPPAPLSHGGKCCGSYVGVPSLTGEWSPSPDATTTKHQ